MPTPDGTMTVESESESESEVRALMTKHRDVNGTTVMTGGVADLIAAAAAAGMLADSLPGESVVAIAPDPVQAAAPAAPAAAAANRPKAATGPGQYTRPNGEVFFSRKIQWGDITTTDVEVLRDMVARMRKAPLLVGAPGCGKTGAIEAAFHQWDEHPSNGLVTLIGSDNTEVADFIGWDEPQPDGTFRWRNGKLTTAVLENRGLYVDEIGRINPKVLTEALFPVMDGRGIFTAGPHGDIKVGDGFFVVASTNPDSPGCVMDDALLSRFAAPIEYTTDYSIAVKFLGVDKDVAALARDIAKDVEAGTAYWCPSMRDLIEWRDTAKVWGTKAAWQGLLTNAPIEARPDIETKVANDFGVRIGGTWRM